MNEGTNPSKHEVMQQPTTVYAYTPGSRTLISIRRVDREDQLSQTRETIARKSSQAQAQAQNRTSQQNKTQVRTHKNSSLKQVARLAAASAPVVGKETLKAPLGEDVDVYVEAPSATVSPPLEEEIRAPLEHSIPHLQEKEAARRNSEVISSESQESERLSNLAKSTKRIYVRASEFMQRVQDGATRTLQMIPVDDLRLPSQRQMIKLFWEVLIVLGLLALLRAGVSTTLKWLHRKIDPNRDALPYEQSVFECMQRPLEFLSVFTVGTSLAEVVSRPLVATGFLKYIRVLRELGVIIAATWFLMRWVDRIRSRFAVDQRVDKAQVDTVSRIVTMIVAIIATLISFDTLGVNVQTVLAFGGIGGVAIGFAGREIMSNFFGGFMIYVTRPFVVGEWIRSIENEQLDGTVEQIGWYMTRVRKWDKRPLYVPNSRFTTLVVENPSRMSNRRIRQDIKLRLEDLPKAEKICNDILEKLMANPDLDPKQHRIVNIENITMNAICIWISCYTKSVFLSDFRRVQQEVILDVVDVIRANNAGLASEQVRYALTGDPRFIRDPVSDWEVKSSSEKDMKSGSTGGSGGSLGVAKGEDVRPMNIIGSIQPPNAPSSTAASSAASSSSVSLNGSGSTASDGDIGPAMAPLTSPPASNVIATAAYRVLAPEEGDASISEKIMKENEAKNIPIIITNPSGTVSNITTPAAPLPGATITYQQTSDNPIILNASSGLAGSANPPKGSNPPPTPTTVVIVASSDTEKKEIQMDPNSAPRRAEMVSTASTSSKDSTAVKSETKGVQTMASSSTGTMSIKPASSTSTSSRTPGNAVGGATNKPTASSNLSSNNRSSGTINRNASSSSSSNLAGFSDGNISKNVIDRDAGSRKLQRESKGSTDDEIFPGQRPHTEAMDNIYSKSELPPPGKDGNNLKNLEGE